jgi:hypothetical protein
MCANCARINGCLHNYTVKKHARTVHYMRAFLRSTRAYRTYTGNRMFMIPCTQPYWDYQSDLFALWAIICTIGLISIGHLTIEISNVWPATMRNVGHSSFWFTNKTFRPIRYQIVIFCIDYPALSTISVMFERGSALS